MIERAHDILLSALALFGPRLFDGFWDTFDQFHLTGSPKQSRLEPNYSLSSDTSRTTNTGDEDHGDTDSEEFSSHGFRAFKDFWDFVSQSFRTPADPVQAKVKNYLPCQCPYKLSSFIVIPSYARYFGDLTRIRFSIEE